MNVYACSVIYRSVIQSRTISKQEIVVAIDRSEARQYLSVEHTNINYYLWKIKKVDQTLPGVVEL